MKTAKGPIELEIFKKRIETITEDMALSIFRTSRSSIVRDTLDYSTALLNDSGELAGQSPSVPMMIGALPDVIDEIKEKHGHDWSDGDIFITNDPYGGAMHLPDIFLVKPVFVAGDLIGFSAAVVHHTDIGGRVPGGNAADSTEIYQEGLRIPLLRFWASGRRNDTLLDVVASNVRVAGMVLGDLFAQESAVLKGESGLVALARDYGTAGLREAFAALNNYSEKLTRAEIAEFPDGTWEFEDFMDGDGISTEPVPIRVKLTIHGDEIEIDTTGTAKQVRTALNSSLSMTKSVVYLVVRALMNEDVPSNGGFFRPISVIAPAGTILNHTSPAACAARGVTAFRFVDTLLGAFAQAMPGRVPAAGDGGNTFVTVGGTDDAGEPYAWVEPIVGSWGGRPTSDGLEGNSPLGANVRNQPVEIVESKFPVRIDEYGYVPDTGGPGRYRGGLAIARQWRLLEGEAVLQVRSDRRRFRPWGLDGGLDGTGSVNILNPGSAHEEELPTKFTRTIKAGDVYRHVIASGGGYGPPLERDPDAVRNDLADEKLTREFAERVYGYRDEDGDRTGQ